MASRYRTIKQFRTPTGKQYTSNVIYPDIPPSEEDFYIISSAGDRYDILAQHFYNDHTLWWIIASANSTTLTSLAITPGLQIRVPAEPLSIIADFEKLNKIR